MIDEFKIRRTAKASTIEELKKSLQNSLYDSKADSEPQRYTWNTYPAGWEKHKSWKFRESDRRRYRRIIRNELKRR